MGCFGKLFGRWLTCVDLTGFNQFFNKLFTVFVVLEPDFESDLLGLEVPVLFTKFSADVSLEVRDLFLRKKGTRRTF